MQSLNFVLEKKRKPQLPSRFPWFVRFTGREFKTSTLYLLLHSSLCSTFALSVFFFRALLCLQRLLVSNCLCVLTVPAIMLWHTLTHRHTQGCLPHHPSQTDTGPAWHLNSTEGTALGSINMHDSIIGYAQTHTRTCTLTHVCAFCIHVQEVLMHTRTAQCIQTCSHTHTHSYSHY